MACLILQEIGKLFSYSLKPPIVASVPIIPLSVIQKSEPLQIHPGALCIKILLPLSG